VKVIVQKFGGTSVQSARHRDRVVELVERARAEGYRPVVVVCASGGRAMQSARWLRSQGFEAMYLIGGVNEWPGRLVK
jgi:aspartokinase